MGGNFKLFGPDTHSGTLRGDQKVFDYIPNFVGEACDVLSGLTYHSYIDKSGSDILTADGLNEQFKESSRVANIFTNKTDSKGKIRIDLHIEQLSSYYVHMQNYEIVQIQMEYCKKELDLSMLKSKHSLEIVHGIGEGVLKGEVHKLLRLYNLNYFESNNGGSTEVIL